MAEVEPCRVDGVEEGSLQVGDLGMTAFLRLNDLETIAVDKAKRSWAVKFRNPNPENLEAGKALFDRLCLNYTNSQFCRFYNEMGNLKKLFFYGPAAQKKPSGSALQVGDLGIGAYLRLNGLETIAVQKGSRNWIVWFRNPNPENPEAGRAAFNALCIRYTNSQFCRFYNEINNVKRAFFHD